jgi:hypothetical protein
VKPCSRCGGPTALRKVRGFEVEACVRCGAVLMDASDLDVIAAGGQDVRTPVPLSTATPSAPPPRWIHKDPSPPQPLYTQVLLPPDPSTEETQAPTVVDGHAVTSEPPPKREPPPEGLPEAPVPTPHTPRSAGPRRRSLKSARTSTPAPPIFRDSERRGSSPTMMPDVAPTGEPELGNFGSAAPGRQGPTFDLPKDPDATEEIDNANAARQATPVSQKTTAPRPPNRAPAALDDPALTEWTRKRSRTRRRLVQVATATWLAIFLALAAVGYLAWQGRALTNAGSPPPDEPLTPTQQEPPGVPGLIGEEDAVDDAEPVDATPPVASPLSAAEPQAEVEAEPTTEPAVAPEPTPVSLPVVAPQPAARPTRPSRQALIDRGWSSVENDPLAAAAAFDRAMAERPSDAEANYGYGYSLVRQGNPQAATFYLCRSLAGANTETRREVAALLGRNGLTCD